MINIADNKENLNIIQSRNSLCLCTSGKKYKHCCMGKSKVELQPMQQFTEDIFKICENKGKLDNANRLLAMQKFNETLIQLERRYIRMKQADLKLGLGFDDKVEAITRGESLANINTQDLQADYYDANEAYFQHVYTLISKFILLLSHIGDRKLVQDMPIKSVEKFLRYMLVKFPNLGEAVAILEECRKYRTYIDHAQQNKLHDWMTHGWFNDSGGHQAAVTHFIRKGSGEVRFQGNNNPYSADYIPEVEHESFIVSPPDYRTYFATKHFIRVVLSSI